MEDLNKHIKKLFYGYSCELLVAYHYLSQFCHVYMPVAPHSKVDLIVESQHGGLTRIQVKKAKFVDRVRTPIKYLDCNTGFNQELQKCEYDFLVVIYGQYIWEIPASEVSTVKITLASDYEKSNVEYKWDMYRKSINFELS